MEKDSILRKDKAQVETSGDFKTQRTRFIRERLEKLTKELSGSPLDRRVEGRIAFLREALAEVEKSRLDNMGFVATGCLVTLTWGEGKEETYLIVSEELYRKHQDVAFGLEVKHVGTPLIGGLIKNRVRAGETYQHKGPVEMPPVKVTRIV